MLKVLLAILVLAGLVRLIDLQKIITAAASANPYLIAAGVALLPFNLFFEALLWHRLLRELDAKAPFPRSFASLLVGNTLGAFTPVRAGEWAGRALYLPLPDKWQLALMTVAHRIMDLTVVLVMGTAALTFFRAEVAVPHDTVWFGFTLLGLVLSSLLLLIVLLPRRAFAVLSRIIRKEERRRHISFLRILTTRSAGVLLFLAWLRYLVYTGQFLLLIFAFAPHAPLLTGYAAVALVMYAKFIIPPVTFSDIGIREGASVFFFGLLGVGGAYAFDASILIFCINLLLPACIGFPLVMRLRLHRGDSSSTSQGAPDETLSGASAVPSGHAGRLDHAERIQLPSLQPRIESRA
ncbi:MAG TPA: lysylphosphatidylglycerol synthase transmembrane domain-containing protein [Rhodothermales bacterium]|nr:lysylphosphatidylglycerol synthase transmembrane domain-containing protein [Rhodothermales bacterium]